MTVCVISVFCFFFFNQKTAYEMRISDWSSDVCSSDLKAHVFRPVEPWVQQPHRIGMEIYGDHPPERGAGGRQRKRGVQPVVRGGTEHEGERALPRHFTAPQAGQDGRSEERRGGKEGGRKGRSGRVTYA